ncbi:hypothetical protein P3T76_002439 [Phytophthora citrophthora]|uniref:Uncharacterized protein n=1 Tax=Phytophthora citrophthora TaxID=4793 RepID=A0AAD9GY39_9STRA|nr:hypothetical protein P3T76_002439 [Phytophthora citrophthora]
MCPFMSEVIVRAQALLVEKANYYVIKDTRSKVVKGILFNASKFLVSAKNIHSAPMNRSRVALNSLTGKLPDTLTVNTVDLHCFLIHQVQLRCVDPVMESGMITVAPSVSKATQGSHVMAAMALQRDISVEGILKSLPVRKLSGGQRKRPGPLAEGGDNTHRFSVDILIRDMLKFPARPLHWNLMREFTLAADDGAEDEQFLLGKVVSWGEKDGIYFWMTTFSHGAQVKMEYQERAECLNGTYTHGADVAGAAA